MSVNPPQEGKKDIVWRGFPGTEGGGSRAREHRIGGGLVEQAHVERTLCAEAIEKKQQQLLELIEQHRMVKQLLEVNPVRSSNETDIALQIPFVLVRVSSD